MASANRCIAQLSRNLVSQPLRPTSQLYQLAFLSSQQLRYASVGKGSHSENAAKYKRKDAGAAQKKKKARSTFIQYDLRDAEQFNLCDAMQYVLS
jgi:large subunit ribosomal protein L1